MKKLLFVWCLWVAMVAGCNSPAPDGGSVCQAGAPCETMSQSDAYTYFVQSVLTEQEVAQIRNTNPDVPGGIYELFEKWFYTGQK